MSPSGTKVQKKMLLKSMLVALGASVLLTACGGSKGASKEGDGPTPIQMQTLNYATEFIECGQPRYDGLRVRRV
jgi:putative aldouronate transport system substrate-binding protein